LPELDLDLAKLKESDLTELPAFSGPARYVWRLHSMNVLFACASQEGMNSFVLSASSLLTIRPRT
jgi:hypothetical protein